MKTDTELEVKYELGHSYQERWAAGELHCPGCGEPGVWEEQGVGDFYCGPSYLCPKCGATFTIQYKGVSENWQDRQRLEAIRAALAELSAAPNSASMPLECPGCGAKLKPVFRCEVHDLTFVQ